MQQSCGKAADAACVALLEPEEPLLEPGQTEHTMTKCIIFTPAMLQFLLLQESNLFTIINVTEWKTEYCKSHKKWFSPSTTIKLLFFNSSYHSHICWSTLLNYSVICHSERNKDFPFSVLKVESFSTNFACSIPIEMQRF